MSGAATGSRWVGFRAWARGQWTRAWAWVQVQWVTERWPLLLYVASTSVIMAWVALRQISAMLGRLEGGGLSATMANLTLPSFRTDSIREAAVAWGGQSEARDIAAWLLGWHFVIDTLFVGLYGFLLWRLLRAAIGTPPPRSIHRGIPPPPPTQPRPLRFWERLFLGLVVAADVVENLLTLWLASMLGIEGGPTDAVVGVLWFSTWVKWIALVLTLSCVLRTWLLRRTPAAATWREQLASGVAQRVSERPGGVRVWRRHRVQVGTVAVLALLVAVPIGGPLDQVPDILRIYADDGPDGRFAISDWWPQLWPSVVTLALFCLALWIAGRWALLDGLTERNGTPLPQLRAHAPGVVLLASGATFFIALWLYSGEPGGLNFNPGIFSIPTVLAVLAAATWPSGSTLRPPTEEVARVDVPGPLRARTRRAARLLAVLPVAIAGLGIVRAFLDPLLAFNLGEPLRARIFLILGMAAVLAVTPALYLILAALEQLLFLDPPDPVTPGVVTLGTAPDDSPWGRRRRLWTTAVAWFVAVWATGLAVWGAAEPLQAGPVLNATGVVSVLLALFTLGGGWLQRRVERRMSYVPTRRLGFGNRTPVFVLSAVVFVVAGLLNVDGGYHQVRLTAATGSADSNPDPYNLDVAFHDWLAQAQDCTVAGPYASEVGPAVPLVLLTAPGGGIRAAYWVDEALHEVETGGQCARQRIFAASGVSGGSVGLVTHYLHADEPPAASGTSHVEALSGEEPLAASTAAMLFRDLPAGLVGLSEGWDDRAAVLERSWEQLEPELGATRLLQHLRPGWVGPEDAQAWRPLLLLNGTEVSTGCRLIVTSAPLVASAASGAPRVCLSPQVHPNGTGIFEGAVDVLGFRDERNCGDDNSVRAGDLRASTAALLSARFPYVSPSGELFACPSMDKPRSEQQAVRASDLDGGAADNSGLATALDLWDALQPIVADHNAGVLRCRQTPASCATSETPTVVPLLIVLDNHYQTTTTPSAGSRQRELIAPVDLLGAKGVLAEQAVLEQEALVTFGGPVPGITVGTDAEAGAPLPVRVFRIGPSIRPGVAAPLGWTLSDLTRADLDGQLDELVAAAEDGCDASAAVEDGPDPADRQPEQGPASEEASEDAGRHPQTLACYLEAIGAV